MNESVAVLYDASAFAELSELSELSLNESVAVLVDLSFKTSVACNCRSVVVAVDALSAVLVDVCCAAAGVAKAMLRAAAEAASNVVVFILISMDRKMDPAATESDNKPERPFARVFASHMKTNAGSRLRFCALSKIDPKCGHVGFYLGTHDKLKSSCSPDCRA